MTESISCPSSALDSGVRVHASFLSLHFCITPVPVIYPASLCPVSVCTVASPRKVEPLPTASSHLRLTPAQDALRRRGLRLLARMIVRAYLNDQAATNGRFRDAVSPGVDS